MARSVYLIRSATSPTDSTMTATLTLTEIGITRSLTVDGETVEVNRPLGVEPATEERFAEVVASYKANGWVDDLMGTLKASLEPARARREGGRTER